MLLIWAKVIVTLIPSVTLDPTSSLGWIYKGWTRERTTFLTITVQWQQRTSKKHDYDSVKHISKRIIPLSLIVCIKFLNSNRKHFVRQEGLQLHFQQNTTPNTLYACFSTTKIWTYPSYITSTRKPKISNLKLTFFLWNIYFKEQPSVFCPYNENQRSPKCITIIPIIFRVPQKKLSHTSLEWHEGE